MPETLHTVTITGDDEHPRIEFTCHGDESAPCHLYARCTCRVWSDHPHPTMRHAACWMQMFFDNDGTNPGEGNLAEHGLKPGMSGPIEASLEPWIFGTGVEWKFTEAVTG